jgi:hypothetical protein
VPWTKLPAIVFGVLALRYPNAGGSDQTRRVAGAPYGWPGRRAALRAVAGALYKATGNGAVPQTTISLIQLRARPDRWQYLLTVLPSTDLRKAG